MADLVAKYPHCERCLLVLPADAYPQPGAFLLDRFQGWCVQCICDERAGARPSGMTYRERREARVERLQGWADKREQRATVAYEAATDLAHVIPFGQPVHGAQDRRYRDRIGAKMDASVEHSRKAASMTERAGNIKSQLETSIYSDDPDAVEALEARLADLERQRSRIKAYNATCRKGARDLSLLDAAQQRELVSILKHSPYQSKNGAMPAYVLTNLTGNITRNRKRLEALRQG